MTYCSHSHPSRLIKDDKPLRVLIVEHDTLTALDYATTIEANGGIVVALAETPLQALAMVMRLRPDVAIINIQLYGQEGIENAHGIAALGTRVVFYCSNGDPATFERVRAFGNARLLLEPVRLSELIEALRG